MVTKKAISILILLVFLTTLFPIITIGAEREDYNLAAEFNITSRETTEHIEAFTFTSTDSIVGSTSPVTNQIVSGGGFEPAVFRNKFSVTDCTDNEIHVSRHILDGYDVYADQFLKGGIAHVYRVFDGELRLIRVSEIEEYNLSGNWKLWSGKAVSDTFANIGFDGWNRSTDYYYAVAAVDSEGNESQLSDWVTVTKKSTHKNTAVNNFTSITGNGNISEVLTAPVISQTVEENTDYSTISWSPVDDAAGYVVYISYHPKEKQKGFYAKLNDKDITTGETAEPLKYLDFVLVSKKFYDWSKEKYFTPRVYDASEGNTKPIFSPETNENLYTWKLSDHENVPAEFLNAGDTYMEITPIGDNQLTNQTPARIQLYNLADGGRGNGTDSHYYKNLVKGSTIVIEFWAKSTNPGDRIVFDIDGGPWGTNWKSGNDMLNVINNTNNLPEGGPITLNAELTHEWKKYSLEYEVKDEPSSPWTSRSRLNVFGNGTISVDAFQMYDKATPPNQWSEAVLQNALKSGFSYNRIHTYIKTGKFTYDMSMLCNPSGAFNKSAAGSTTLDTFLKNTQNAKMNPWFQIEFHMSPDEWLGWMDYMCEEYDPENDTPESKPYAYKRYAAGQKEPWIDMFDSIYFEVANETWNTMFAPWNFDAMIDAVNNYNYKSSEVYGLFHEFIINIFKQSEHWYKMEPKFKSILGGWSNGDYEMNAGKWTKSADFLTRAEYNGGWDDGTILTDDEKGYFHTSVFAMQGAKPAGENFTRSARRFNETRPLGSYEAGPGYPLPGYNLAPEVQLEHEKANNVQKSLTGAVSTLDAFLLNAAYYRHATQNFFTFSSGNNYWTSHAELKDGGQEHPAFRALTMHNNYTTGKFLQVDEISVPIYDIEPVLNKSDNVTRLGVDDAPMVGAYATFDGNKYSVYVISRKIPGYPYKDDDGYTPVILNMPFDKVYKINVRKMTGNYDANNLNADNVKIQEQLIPITEFSRTFVLNEKTGAEENGIPPSSIYQYDFYLKYDGLPNQPELRVTEENNGVILDWEDVNAIKYFIYSSNDINGIYELEGVTFGETQNYTVENAGNKYYYVRAFNETGYRDSLVMSADSEDPLTEPDMAVTEEIVIDAPPPVLDIDLLLWDNFTYTDETEVADDTPLNKLKTGPAGLGWITNAEDWITDWMTPSNPSHDHVTVYNANANPSRRFLEYGDLMTSGLYASAKRFSLKGDGQGNTDPEMTWHLAQRLIETNNNRDHTRGKTLAMDDYIGVDKGNGAGDVGGISGKTLWSSALIRSGNANITANTISNYGFYCNRNAENFQLVIGYSEQTKRDDVYYWGIKYVTKDNSSDSPAEYKYIVTDLPVTKDEAVLAVVKFDFEMGNDVATVWLNPGKESLGEDKPTNGAKIYANGEANEGTEYEETTDNTKIYDDDGIRIEFDTNVRLRTNIIGFINTSAAFDFDVADIRFGRTYESVTPTLTEGIKVVGGKITDVSFRPDGVNENARIILGVYDNKKFEEAHVFGRSIPLSNEWLVNLSLRSFNIMMPEGKNVQMFVWDDLKTMKPLTEEVFETH